MDDLTELVLRWEKDNLKENQRIIKQGRPWKSMKDWIEQNKGATFNQPKTKEIVER